MTRESERDHVHLRLWGARRSLCDAFDLANAPELVASADAFQRVLDRVSRVTICPACLRRLEEVVEEER